MPRPKDKHQLVLHVGLDMQFGVEGRPDEAQVQLLAEDPVHHVVACQDVQGDLQARIPGLKGGQRPGKEIVSRGAAGAEVQSSAFQALQLVQGAPGLVSQDKDPLGVVGHETPGLRQDDAAAQAVEELGAQLLLQVEDVLGDGRLTDVEVLGGAAVALAPPTAWKTRRRWRLSVAIR